ncbi:SRPBCC family protein [Christiangramia salexigens]|uniref:Activator of Hsp90 ATPase homologue 1/2-like C-terminal domain-containing protein n=1 Tax=Christiangramia salexigens TaxID=1913577 RepID=A0A1L3J1X6_9FLAO|nr:SRPBCC domain-containing protein [Christiangramia salexigens]APG59134.1 hypothetical protein LPB144_01365 [Christiangramia salexigens]
MNNSSIEINRTISAPVQRVWEALTDPEKMKLWYFDVHEFKPETGNKFYFYEPGSNKYLHQCEIMDFIPKRCISYTWSYPEYTNRNSLVSWNLEPLGEETKLSFSHIDVQNLKDDSEVFSRENFEKGWDEIINKNLVDFVSS